MHSFEDAANNFEPLGTPRPKKDWTERKPFSFDPEYTWLQNLKIYSLHWLAFRRKAQIKTRDRQEEEDVHHPDFPQSIHTSTTIEWQPLIEDGDQLLQHTRETKQCWKVVLLEIHHHQMVLLLDQYHVPIIAVDALQFEFRTLKVSDARVFCFLYRWHDAPNSNSFLCTHNARLWKVRWWKKKNQYHLQLATSKIASSLHRHSK